MKPVSGNRVVIYARVSTSGQADAGHSLDAQIADAEAYARLYGLTVVETIVDAGVSAKSLDRPGVDRVLQLVGEQAVDGVIVYKLDRLTRSIVDLGRLLDQFQQDGIALISVCEKFDTATAMGRFSTGIIGLIAQWQREDIGERTRRGLAQARRGGTHTGRAPFGYLHVDGKLAKHPDHHRTLTAIRRWHRQGQSYARIAERLNQSAVPTATGQGQWHKAGVARVAARRPRLSSQSQ